MATIAMMVGGSIVNALAFLESNFLFSSMRESNAKEVEEERKRHNNALSYFRSNQKVIIESDTINASLDTSIQRIQETLGSGWGVDKIDSLYLDIANYMPFKGGSYIDV